MVPLKMILIATHADQANYPRNNRGEFVCREAQIILTKAQALFGNDMEIVDRIFVVDTQVAGSSDMKALKKQIADMKASIVKVNISYKVTIFAFSFVSNDFFLDINFCSSKKRKSFVLSFKRN